MKAILFDLNGTMIDDMRYHTEAWYRILVDEHGADLSMEEVKKEMYGKNQEVLERVFGENHFTAEEMEALSIGKEKQYQEAFRPHLKLIEGLDRFLEKAHEQGIKMAVASAAIPFNIDFVLDGLDIRKYISAVVSADDVKRSKPDPETFVMAAEKLGVQPEDCIVFEDNPKGVESALNGSMKVVVIKTAHEEHEFEGLSNILRFIDDYNDPYLEDLLRN
ncbi:HAD family hydrolase [Arcticibacter tournemirensis]|uniref:HAD family phosphatase n=1 Tax=Arcticibacter tournemirensis TaxID=699437 RepID=A0A4Q0M2C3_9SPHI|nr:HAD family phosphatase [Arcticibacter tournemirensis]RXF66988.1 HAD family phosphatase [Arcticibacter tournemirensis]